MNSKTQSLEESKKIHFRWGNEEMEAVVALANRAK